MSLKATLKEVRSCRACAPELSHEPRPTLSLSSPASLIIIGQAPGTRVHETGIPWNDASGDHLRQWLAIDRDTFYDTEKVGIMPMGFCYPGKGKGGDLPPRKECAPLWHARLLGSLRRRRLTLLVGKYAVDYYLARTRKRTLTETVRTFEDYLPEFFPLPHPRWRSRIWMKKNPWFEVDVLPALRESIRKCLQ